MEDSKSEPQEFQDSQIIYNEICKGLNENNNYPSILYKYLTIDGASALINNLTLKYSRPVEFDDIFEFSEQGLVQHDSVKKGDFIDDLQKSDKDYEILNFLKEKVGVLCLSDSMDINIMWSLYADKHDGVVIGIKSEFITPLTQIRYVPENQEKESFASIEEQAKYMIFTKTDDWKWQREWRSIELLSKLKFENNMYLKKIPKDAIAEIYIGIASNEIYKSVDDKHIQFEEIVKEKGLNASIYACMKDLQARGKISFTQIC